MLDKIKNKQNNNSKNPENQNDLSGVKKKKKEITPKIKHQKNVKQLLRKE